MLTTHRETILETRRRINELTMAAVVNVCDCHFAFNLFCIWRLHRYHAIFMESFSCYGDRLQSERSWFSSNNRSNLAPGHSRRWWQHAPTLPDRIPAFKMAARIRPWQPAGHVSPNILDILNDSKWRRALRLANFMIT